MLAIHYEMRPFTLLQISRQSCRCSPNARRTLQLDTSKQSVLHKELTSRRPNILYDYLSPTPSHLLNISLADFLPSSCHPPSFSVQKPLPLARPDRSKAGLLPQGHHSVYFAPQIPASSLLSDGTDPLQSPGPPFVRRLWAGGSVLFNTSMDKRLQLDDTRAACLERISDVTFKGAGSEEKVFVNIERRIGVVEPRVSKFWSGYERSIDDERLMQRFYQVEDEDDLGQASLVEMRNIVFMREKTGDTAKQDADKPGKVLKRKL